MTLMKVFEESVLENGLVKCQIVDTILGNIITEFYTNLNDLDTMVDMEGISYVNLPATFYNNISTIVCLDNLNRILTIIQSDIITKRTTHKISVLYDDISML